ncbi:Mediator of RNA polymerase II transcription subunit 14 [Desmophyllum pertusum]|uniref:Mediator of RNA polymerase II transcription subunit 14 n=1 Tax=Desmophyllum pertusum TaxID=174260 RepID=A0A9X0CW50_9CNID|nr:Mediator of RNA polymerase II transcription subunit 14 [Desmophyllum pertusum]
MGHVVAICHARIPFIQLREELSRHKILYQDLTSEGGVGLAVRLSNLPLPKDCDRALVTSLQPSVLDCVLRLPGESQRTCLLEMIMDNCPLEGLSASEKACAKLYRHAVELDAFLKDSQSHFRHMCRVYSYNYKQLTLQYDPDKQSLVTFEWSVEQAQFVLTFSYCGLNLSANPHCLTSRHLQQEFNSHQSLPYIVQILHETFRPLSAIAKLSTKPVLGIQSHRPLVALRKFVVLPQSSTHVLLNYRKQVSFHSLTRFCSNALEVRFRSKNLVAIRDASYSIVDPSKSRAGLSSIQNLKVFLQLYVDEVAKVGGITSRHASTADDEAPPSPITMETDTPVIDAQFTSPQPMPLTASP